MEALNNAIGKVPFLFFALIYCAWQGYSYYDWLHSPSSELGQKKSSAQTAKQTLEAAKKKLVIGEEFYKNLDVLRARIRQLTAQLDSTKTILNTDIDIANFIRMITLEAKKLGLVIKGIKPGQEVKKDYYIEVPFTVQFRGAYVQLLVFLDRVAKLQQVIRVADFEMKPSGNTATKYVDLEGSAKLVTFRYLGTPADEVVKKETMKSNEKPGDSK